MKSILCIEDNPEIQILVEGSLSHYRVVPVSTLSEAKVRIDTEKFALVILDLELPDGDGLKFMSQNASHPNLKSAPVIVLTGKSETANQVIAFSLGVEDFVAKPFDPLVLRARVDAKIRKTEAVADRDSNLRLKDLLIDIPKQRVYRTTASGQEAINLTSIEFKLLVTFGRAPERVFSRNQLLDEVWGNGVAITDRTVDTHVGHLRKKISDSQVKIETVINEGYRLVP